MSRINWKQVKFIAFDFDGVFTDNGVYVFEDGREAVRCSRGDGMGIGLLMKAGIPCCVISKEKNPVVSARCRKLNIKCIQGCEDKIGALNAELSRLGIGLNNAAYMGNDINDAECLEAVALPIVVKDAHPDVLHLGKYVTTNVGGHGAVREVCDHLVRAWSKA